jgi:methylase of polypeptide subunit release factors
VPLTTQTMGFGSLEISYDEEILRPRPWTAQQSRWAAELLVTAPAGPVLELCAGAGQIGLLTISLRSRPLVCVDSSARACAHARHNAAAAGLADLVEVRQQRLEDAAGPGERFALVLADPPWVPSAEIGRFPDDPPQAIDGGPDGLDLARICLRVADSQLLPGAPVLLQLGGRDQVSALAAGLAGLRVEEVRDGAGGVLVLLRRTGD